MEYRNEHDEERAREPAQAGGADAQQVPDGLAAARTDRPVHESHRASRQHQVQPEGLLFGEDQVDPVEGGNKENAVGISPVSRA